jgi:hypothetical protein
MVTSRYRGIDVAELALGGGRSVVYVRRRFLPPTSPAPAVLAEHEVTQGDRLDNLTARYLGDPELFWRVCDANPCTRPDELTGEQALGRHLVIPLPQAGA